MTQMSSEEMLKHLIQNGMNQELDAEEMAEYIADSGFVHVVTGHIAADIIQWVAREAQIVRHHAEQAENIALPEGTTGVADAIAEGDTLTETPDEWLFDLADKVRKGEV